MTRFKRFEMAVEAVLDVARHYYEVEELPEAEEAAVHSFIYASQVLIDVLERRRT